MTDKQRQIASYVSRNRILGPYATQARATGAMVPPHAWLHAMARQLPPLEQFRRELVEDSEFQALKLGSWLSTTDGQIIAEAVGAVIPPLYGPAYELAVSGLTLAAEDQAKAGRETAGAIALGSILVGGAIALAAGSDA
ncbi:MAG: hypothetical protein ACLP1Q_18895 [Solirubrobacteraceae bacterium]|jgi:hypothetical protein